MATDGPMATPTDPILTLTQWFSPAYPVGAFHFSHGLEAAIDDGTVTDQISLSNWVSDVLEHGSGRNDALLLSAAARRTEGEIPELDELALALCASRERRIETRNMGQAFARISGEMLGMPIRASTYPVAVGHAVGLANLPLQTALELYLQAFVANLVAVGQRLIPIGQTEGQHIIQAMAPVIGRLAEETKTGDLDLLASSAFAGDIASMAHETQYSRIFRT